MLTRAKPTISELPVARHGPLSAEAEFYSAYDWCLDPHLTIGDAVGRLAGEIDKLPATPEGWQTREVATNVYLLSCSLINGIDEYLRGYTLRLPAQLATTIPGRTALWVAEQIGESLSKQNRTRVSRWKKNWEDALDGFFVVLARGDADPLPFAESAEKLSELLQSTLSSEVQELRLGVPSAFSRLDITHSDVLALGRQFMRQCPDRSQPILFLGLRTGGTYFSALLRSFFRMQGYQRATSLTVQPIKGPSRQESRELTRCAREGFTLVIVDDPPHSGGAIVLAVNIARETGFDFARIKALLPTHAAAPDWAKNFPKGLITTLEPERWQKSQLLDARNVEKQLSEYYAEQEISHVRIVDGSRGDEINAEARNGAGSKRGTMLKRIFEVQLRNPHGKNEIRFVLAKSVGLGYFGYPAFIAAHRLSKFVPPVLGLRDGILYAEWLPQQSDDSRSSRELRIDTAAAYVAARTRELCLPKSRSPGKAVHENGLELLAEALGRAYGRFAIDILVRSWILQQLCRLCCPFPTLIDGDMGRGEWIEGISGPLKTGYCGHGLGKTQLNAIDPAYDLAETILSFALSSEEESRFIHRYVEYSGDVEVGQRLFINKLLVGLWTFKTVQEQLFAVMQSSQRQRELHDRFLGAWDFLTVQTARFCGARCRPSQLPRWRSPLVMLDIDGVLDRRMFGYPCTTAAGMEALSLLEQGGYSVALNTARSASEVRDYCEAYALAGGVAEHGAYVWDAVAQCGQALLDRETMSQLDTLREQLRKIPGIFLDDRHQYSIRAYMFEKKQPSSLLRLLNSIRSFNAGIGVPVPLPTLLLNDLITTSRLNRLCFHHTTIDTAIVAKKTDKGTGLVALRDRVLGPDAETIAVGDSQTDLPMFRAATRSFAPAQISCRRRARLLGCSVSRYPYQRGLLDIVRTVVGSGPGGGSIEATGNSDGDLFMDALRAADHLPLRALVRALFDRATFEIFTR